jgi:hypothetical protein
MLWRSNHPKNLLFISNGYPEKLVLKTIEKSWESETLKAALSETGAVVENNERKDIFDVFHAPYVEGFSEGLQKKLKKLGIGFVPKKGITLYNHLCQLKQKKSNDQQKDDVYSIKCASCKMRYIGETSQFFGKRKYQHTNAVKRKVETNGIYCHLKSNKEHMINWDKVIFLDHEKQWHRRKIKESIYINALNPTEGMQKVMNIEKGYRIDTCWNFFNDEIRKYTSRKFG